MTPKNFGKVEVILNIFSGEPNPRWLLDEVDSREVNRRLATLESSPGKETERTLGYRGFLIVEARGASPNEEVRVFRGIVESTRGAFLDKNRSLERWLLKSAKDELPSDLQEVIQGDLDR